MTALPDLSSYSQNDLDSLSAAISAQRAMSRRMEDQAFRARLAQEADIMPRLAYIDFRITPEKFLDWWATLSYRGIPTQKDYEEYVLTKFAQALFERSYFPEIRLIEDN